MLFSLLISQGIIHHTKKYLLSVRGVIWRHV